MTDNTDYLSSRRLRTPRAAAISGIIFGVLSIITFTIFNLYIPPLEEDTGAWLETSSASISLALALIPFAGIAFLWFMGVVRDRMGLLEDQFFSTLFFGSGLLYLAMVFAGAAMAGGTLMVYAFDPTIVTEGQIYFFARAMMHRINNVYAIRMAGMHMFVLGTIWVRTKIMPRWIAIITYALALLLLVGVGFAQWMTEVFPVWVLFISAYILFLNYRFKRMEANITSDEISAEEQGYPLHPTLEDCEKLTTPVQNFCYDDVAEITGKVEICDRIWDRDIKKHCVARVTLDSSLCLKIIDEGLREGCLESIELKKRVLGVK